MEHDGSDAKHNRENCTEFPKSIKSKIIFHVNSLLVTNNIKSQRSFPNENKRM